MLGNTNTWYYSLVEKKKIPLISKQPCRLNKRTHMNKDIFFPWKVKIMTLWRKTITFTSEQRHFFPWKVKINTLWSKTITFTSKLWPFYLEVLIRSFIFIPLRINKYKTKHCRGSHTHTHSLSFSQAIAGSFGEKQNCIFFLTNYWK